MTHLTVVRHGQTGWNAEGRIQGHTDTELSADGRRQAHEAAIALAGTTFDQIYSSDLRRARETAQPLASRQNLPIHEEAGLREWHMGQYEGLTYQQAKELAGSDYGRFRSFEPGYAVPGGEAYADFHQRVLATVSTIVHRHPGQRVAIFTHGGAVLALLRHLARLPLDAAALYKIPNICITRISCLAGADAATWQLLETEAKPYETAE